MAAARFLPQELLERFDVENAIGRSDRWETYVAEDREEGGTCVIRVDRELPASPRDRRYLEESFLKLRRIRHPGLPRLIHVGMPRSGGMYLVHEFVHGVNLRNAAPHIGLAGIVDVLAKALPALHLLHLHGIVHQPRIST